MIVKPVPLSANCKFNGFIYIFFFFFYFLPWIFPLYSDIFLQHFTSIRPYSCTVQGKNIKHLMAGPKGNSEFSFFFPETLNGLRSTKSFALLQLPLKFAAVSGNTT